MRKEGESLPAVWRHVVATPGKLLGNTQNTSYAFCIPCAALRVSKFAFFLYLEVLDPEVIQSLVQAAVGGKESG